MNFTFHYSIPTHTCQLSRVSLDCPGILAFVQGSRDLVHLTRDFGILECMVVVLQRVYNICLVFGYMYSAIFLQFETCNNYS